MLEEYMHYPLIQMAVKIQKKYDCELEECNFLNRYSHALHGFVFRFKNGYCLSVQFSWGHYCDNYDMTSDESGRSYDHYLKSNTAEIAITDGKNLLSVFRSHDTVRGYLSIPQIMRYANKVSKWENIK